MKNCIAGCKVFSNVNSGELEYYHHEHCQNYPESMSEIVDKLKSETSKYHENNDSSKTLNNKQKTKLPDTLLNFLCYLVDNCDGEVITEEFLLKVGNDFINK